MKNSNDGARMIFRPTKNIEEYHSSHDYILVKLLFKWTIHAIFLEVLMRIDVLALNDVMMYLIPCPYRQGANVVNLSSETLCR